VKTQFMVKISKLFPLLVNCVFGRFLAKPQSIAIKRVRGLFVSGNKSVSIGRDCVISNVDFSDGVCINDSVRLVGGPKIQIGVNVYINSFTMIGGDVLIEDGVLISQFVNIWGRAHRFMARDKPIWEMYGKHGVDDQGYDIAPIKIGRGTWIGPHVTIFRGVNIGKGAVIGANSVVTKDVPEYAVCFGVPARVVKFRQ